MAATDGFVVFWCMYLSSCASSLQRALPRRVDSLSCVHNKMTLCRKTPLVFLKSVLAINSDTRKWRILHSIPHLCIKDLTWGKGFSMENLGSNHISKKLFFPVYSVANLNLSLVSPDFFRWCFSFFIYLLFMSCQDSQHNLTFNLSARLNI